MATNSIVRQLADWVRENSSMLAANGVELDARFPEPGSLFPLTASVGFITDEIVASYTVWEQTVLQTELIVMNTRTKRAVVIDDRTPERASVVTPDLDDVIKKILDGSYARIDSKQKPRSSRGGYWTQPGD